MKVKKILLKIGGILQIIKSSFFALLGGLLLLLRPIVKTIISELYNTYEKEMETTGGEEIDPVIQELLATGKEEFSAYFLKWTGILAGIILVVAIIGLVLGIFYIKFSNKYEVLLASRKGRKILVGILTAVFSGFSLVTPLVIIALCLPEKKASAQEINT